MVASRQPVLASLPLSVVLLLALVGVAPGQPVEEQAPLPEGRIMHGAVVLGDWLYAIGGVLMPGGNEGPDDFTSTVLRSPVSPDGKLGPWQPTTPLPENRHYIEAATVVHREHVYVVGGKSGEAYRNTVFCTSAGPDGHLLPWRESPPFLPEGLAFVTTVTTPGHLHVVGGRRPQAVTSDEVITGPIEADGSIVRWQAAPKLPMTLWLHGTVATAGRLWVWGGLKSDDYAEISDVVYSAPLLGNGSIGEWSAEQLLLPTPWFGGVGAAAGDFLMTFMPRIGSELTADIWFSQFQSNGHPGQWQRVPTQLPVRVYFGLATDFRRNRMYIVGGKWDRGSTLPDPRVFSLTLATPKLDEADPAPAASSPSVAAVAAATPDTPAAPSAPARPAAGFGAAIAHVRQAAGPAETASRPVMTSSASPAVSATAGETALTRPPGFGTYDEARRFATMPPGRPLLVLFHHPGSRISREQLDALMAAPGRLQALTSKAVFALVDVRDEAQLAQQLGVARTPAWLVWDRIGTFRGKTGAMSLEELERGVGGL